MGVAEIRKGRPLDGLFEANAGHQSTRTQQYAETPYNQRRTVTPTNSSGPYFSSVMWGSFVVHLCSTMSVLYFHIGGEGDKLWIPLSCLGDAGPAFISSSCQILTSPSRFGDTGLALTCFLSNGIDSVADLRFLSPHFGAAGLTFPSIQFLDNA